MSDYINKDELLALLSEIKNEAAHEGEAPFLLARMMNAAENMPAADVRGNARGLWLQNPEKGFCKCSVCQELYPLTDYVLAWQYCPACGAYMGE